MLSHGLLSDRFLILEIFYYFMENIKRCSWCNGEKIYQDYHDNEWGVPVYEDRTLFEFLVLEGAQAGLSWITILKKRENYREAFDGFDFKKVALYTEADVERLMGDSGIVRHRGKILSAINNAKAFIEVRDEFESFDKYLWGLVGGKVLVCDKGLVSNGLSDLISLDLRKRGFNFVGTRIIYAFLQAVGVLWGHEARCFKHKA